MIKIVCLMSIYLMLVLVYEQLFLSVSESGSNFVGWVKFLAFISPNFRGQC